MKSKERHKLKENEFARTVVHARELVQTRGRDFVSLAVIAVVAILIAGGYAWWRQSRTRVAPPWLMLTSPPCCSRLSASRIACRLVSSSSLSRRSDGRASSTA